MISFFVACFALSISSFALGYSLGIARQVGNSRYHLGHCRPMQVKGVWETTLAREGAEETNR